MLFPGELTHANSRHGAIGRPDHNGIALRLELRGDPPTCTRQVPVEKNVASHNGTASNFEQHDRSHKLIPR